MFPFLQTNITSCWLVIGLLIIWVTCGKTIGCIVMPLGTEVGPDHAVLDGGQGTLEMRG